MITGRTGHFVNAFGENVIVEEIERAAAMACVRTRAELVEFTVAPVYPGGSAQPARHEWAVEVPLLPLESRRLRASRRHPKLSGAQHGLPHPKRAGDVGMAAPRGDGGGGGRFHRWLAARNKLGDQHKVPRACNQRDLIEAVLAAARLREPRRETAAR